ncbi:MAG: hypothetical protein ABL952_11815 [Pyrinomonadaceae bacterium]
MRIIVSVLVFSMAAVAAAAQSRQNYIFWSGDKACGQKSSEIPDVETVMCSSTMTERGPVSTISHRGISLAVAFLDDDEYSIVAARVTNSNSEVIAFDSDVWGAAHFKAKTDFYSGGKPLVAETSIPSRNIIRRMIYANKLENSLDAVNAEGVKTSETKTVRRPDGTTQRVDMIVPDKEAQAASERRGLARSELITNEQRRIRSAALTAKSVQAGASVAGLVYFRRVKKADFVLYSLTIGETTFVFQLPRKTK